MLEKVSAYADKYSMLLPGDGIVVGVSGGADSVCLLRILVLLRERLDLRLRAVHVNHGIRGAQADADEEFVRLLCLKLNVDFEAVHVDIPALAPELKMTEEEAGRRARYEAFTKECGRCGFDKIAVAHNRDDLAETVFLNIVRGTGIRGLRGIVPVRSENGISIIRPLLECSRAEIEEYLALLNQDYVTDATNLTNDYGRNKVRNTVLPLIREQLNSEVSEHIAVLAQKAAELDEMLEELTDGAEEDLRKSGRLSITTEETAPESGRPDLVTGETATKSGKLSLAAGEELPGTKGAPECSCIRIDIDALKCLKKPVRQNLERRLMGRLAGSLKDIENRHIEMLERLVGLGTGRRQDMPYGITARTDYGSLILEKKDGSETKNRSSADTITPGFEVYECDAAGISSEGMLRVYLKEYTNNLDVPKNNCTKWFDYDKISGNISIRTRRDKDAIRVAGADGELHRKPLSRWFIDNRVSTGRRDEITVLAVDSEILWVIGGRGSDAYFVDAFTKNILVAEYRAGE